MRERETAQALLEKNGGIDKMQATLRTFGKQIEKVVGKVNAINTQRYDADDQSAKDMNMK